MSNEQVTMQVVGPGTVPLLISHRIALHRLASPCIALHCIACWLQGESYPKHSRLIVDLSLAFLSGTNNVLHYMQQASGVKQQPVMPTTLVPYGQPNINLEVDHYAFILPMMTVMSSTPASTYTLVCISTPFYHPFI